jgi:hypothetical protein
MVTAETSGSGILIKLCSFSGSDETGWWEMISVVRVLNEASCKYTASVDGAWAEV